MMMMSCSVECRSKEEQSTPAWDPCPVLWKFNHDQNRIPETLVEAECLQCQMCQDLDAEDLGIGCGPVHYLTKVLRRKSSCDSLTGHYIYVEVRNRRIFFFMGGGGRGEGI